MGNNLHTKRTRANNQHDAPAPQLGHTAWVERICIAVVPFYEVGFVRIGCGARGLVRSLILVGFVGEAGVPVCAGTGLM